MTSPIRLLIVDDSAVVRRIIANLVKDDPEIVVVGEACNGKEAVELVQQLKPDLITMDIRMPVMDGFEATYAIMHNYPIPIVVVSASVNRADLNITFNALKAGAVDVIEKPRTGGEHSYQAMQSRFIRTLKSMAQVKVIRRRFPAQVESSLSSTNAVIIAPQAVVPEAEKALFSHQMLETIPDDQRRIIVMGASTGGPRALEVVLGELPPDLPVPILVVQHIARGFVKGFAEWLNSRIKLTVSVPEPYDKIKRGNVYVAPDDHQMLASPTDIIRLTQSPPVNGFRPSIDVLFKSIARYYGSGATAVLLTGMGCDGAQGLGAIKEAGGYTIAQDRTSSLVFGMPQAAIAMGHATSVLPLNLIALRLKELVLRRLA